MNTKKIPIVIDMFAGVGGLSLGAERAGFRVAAAIENDKNALKTHKKNFPATFHVNSDANELTGEKLLNLIEEEELDGLIGGPPCQGFSMIGRQDKSDYRNNLFIHFFKLISETNPKFFLAENVPGIMNKKFDDIRFKAFSQISRNFHLLNPLMINASDYGAPTSRTRVFFIGYRKSEFNSFNESHFDAPSSIKKTYVKDALRGLPTKIDPEWLSEEDGWREVGSMPSSNFFKKIIGEIPEGVGDEFSLMQYKNNRLVSGCLGTRHSDVVAERYGDVIQGGLDKISRSPKLHPEKFCPTIRAGTGSDKGSFQAVRPLHPTEKRVITPREAARLQGFPDWFIFHKTKWHSFRQIGNSVCPLVAEYLLKSIKNKLKYL